jgi:hypothetical protein
MAGGEALGSSNVTVAEGTIAEIAEAVDPTRTLEAAALTQYNIREESLRHIRFWLPDGVLYTCESGEPCLYHIPGILNPILKFPVDAMNQLAETGNFHPPDSVLAQIMESNKAIRISDLQLTTRPADRYGHDEFSYWEFEPKEGEDAKTHFPSKARKIFFESFYGRGQDGLDAMTHFREEGLTFRLWTLFPEYVEQKAREKGPFCRICRYTPLQGVPAKASFEAEKPYEVSTKVRVVGDVRGFMPQRA